MLAGEQFGTLCICAATSTAHEEDHRDRTANGRPYRYAKLRDAPHGAK